MLISNSIIKGKMSIAYGKLDERFLPVINQNRDEPSGKQPREVV